MRRVTEIVTSIATAFIIMANVTAAPVNACGESRPLTRRLSAVDNEGGTLLAALYRFGHDNGICLGVILADKALLGAAPNMHEREMTVAAALRALLREIDGYQFGEEGSVVVVRPVTGSPSWLRQRIPHFKSDRMPFKFVSEFQLKGALKAVQHPAAGGTVGSIIGGDVRNLVGPLNESNKSVEDLLSQLLSLSRGGMWVAFSDRDKQPNWLALEYGGPVDEGFLTLRAVANMLPP